MMIFFNLMPFFCRKGRLKLQPTVLDAQKNKVIQNQQESGEKQEKVVNNQHHHCRYDNNDNKNNLPVDDDNVRLKRRSKLQPTKHVAKRNKVIQN